MDIRSYFKAKPNGHSDSPKRKIISDDEEDKKKSKKLPQTKKRRVLVSDDEESPKKKVNGSAKKGKTPEKPKEVNVSHFFGKSPVKRVEKEKKQPPPKPVAVELSSDDEFEKSIAQLPDFEESSASKENGNHSKKSSKTPTKTPEKKKASEKEKSPEKAKKDSSKTPKKEVKKEKISPVTVKTEKSEEKPSKSKTPIKPEPSKSSSEDTPKVKSEKKERKPKKEKEESDLETSVRMDEDRHEKKQLMAIMYQKYKNRSSVLNPGSKEIPEGKPNCLEGKSFLVTGILESMERKEAEELIKKYGGKISAGVTKKLNFIVVGEEAGPSKLSKAEDLNVKQLTEDGLLDMIRESNEDKKPKPKEKTPKKSEKEIKKERKSPEMKKNSSEKKNKTPVKKHLDEEEFTEHVVKKKIKLEDDNVSPGSSKEPEIELKNIENMAFVDKYKPTSTKAIIGQQGAASNCAKLIHWLKNWYSNHDGKKKLTKPSPWAKNDDGAYFKAALLSGPPGVGKTTTASLVCKELGFDTVEFNASDTRSKKQLKEHVSELLKNKSLFGYFHGDQSVSHRHVLLMDEVDGMAGNEDRGGMQELIGLIKETSIPIICMCNDRNHPKIRSLVNYCFDLRFQRPRLPQIKGAMMSVCFKEGISVDSKTLDDVITATNNDVRQTLNYLAMIGAGKNLPKSTVDDKKIQEQAKKDLKIGPFEVVRKVFSAEEQKGMSMNDKSDLFFQDYSMGPLFVYENYLHVAPHGDKSQVLTKVAKAASSLSRGDLVEKRIRTNNNWSILPVQAMFSSVIPGEFMSGHVTGQINFPGWLGKFSKRNKRHRLAQEIHDHTRVSTSGSRMSVRMDYAPYLLSAIIKPLVDEGAEGVPKALEIMKEYRLTKDDIESLIELNAWPGKKNPMDAVESKVKAALTRAYNKEMVAFSHSTKKKKTVGVEEDGELYDEEGNEVEIASDEEKDDDKLDNDALIKMKKKPASAKTEKAENSSKPKKETKSKKASTKK